MTVIGGLKLKMNDVAVNVAQQEHSNNKCYASAFSNE